MRKFNLGPEAAKNTDYTEKCFKQKLRRIKFPKKKLSGRISLSTPGVQPEGLQRFGDLI